VAVLEGLAMQVFLETQRLVLRRFSVADADNLVSLDADPDVMRFVPGGTSTSREEIEDEYLPAFLGYYRRYEGYGFWAVIEKASRATPGKRASGCAGRWCPGHGRLSGTRPSMTVAPRSMRLMLQVPGMRPSAWARKPGSAGCGHFRYGSARPWCCTATWACPNGRPPRSCASASERSGAIWLGGCRRYGACPGRNNPSQAA
jgi:hypothetical protein